MTNIFPVSVRKRHQNKTISEIKTFSKTLLRDKCDAVLTTMPDRFAREPKKFPLVWKWFYENKISLKKHFSSKRFPGHVECSFRTTHWEFSPEGWKRFSQTPKKDQKHKEIKKTFFFIVFLWARKMQICLSRPNNFMLFEGELKFFCSISETD